MKKNLSLIVALLLLASCAIPNSRGSRAITKNFELNNKQQIDLSSAIDGQWDTVYMFSPYTSKKMISDTIGRKWKPLYFTRISYDDGISLLVFTKDKKVIKYIEHPRNKGDFSGLYRKEGYKKAEAIFIIDPKRKDRSWPSLIQKQ